MHYWQLSAVELAEQIRNRSARAVDVVTQHLERIDRWNPHLNAFLYVAHEEALARAKQIDERLDRGEDVGPLAGVPVAVKDNVCVTGMPTTCGSRMLAGWISPYDATLARRLLDAGAIIIGKTNMDEFAMGSSNETSAFGPVHNPWNLDHIPGGSGGGSAAAVAAQLVPLAIGTDTGGSIRQPGAHTGTIGVKPTYGAVSRYGVVAMASSLDQPGPCAKTVADAALLHSVIAGHDPMDSTSIASELPDVTTFSQDISQLRVGIVSELGALHPETERVARQAFEALGKHTDVVEISCPSFDYALNAYYLIMPAELSSNMARFDAVRYGVRVGDDGTHSVEEVTSISRGRNFGAEVKKRIVLGTYALSSGYYDQYYGAAQKVRTLVAEDFARAFEQVDVLISPTTPVPPMKIGGQPSHPMERYKADLCTVPANLAGNAAASFPVGLTADGLPVGVQVIAPPLADERLYRIGAFLEDALPMPALDLEGQM